MFKKNIFICFLIFFIFLLDRITKILVIFKARELNESEIFSSNFINFHLIWNEGIAFGLFSFSDSIIYQIITLIIILVIAAREDVICMSF